MRLQHKVAALAVALSGLAGLTACQQQAPSSQTATSKSATATAPTPPAGWETAFPNCTWGEVKGQGVSLWAFACPNDTIVYDAALPGFVREMSGENAAKAAVVQLFTKPNDAPIDAALPAIRAASEGGAACVLEQIKDAPAGEFQLMPTGAAAKAYQDDLAGTTTTPNLLPCGPLGPSEAGMRMIRAVPGAPTLVAVIHIPSDIPTFDPSTLKAAP